jgi:hypothetical protein
LQEQKLTNTDTKRIEYFKDIKVVKLQMLLRGQVIKDKNESVPGFDNKKAIVG